MSYTPDIFSLRNERRQRFLPAWLPAVLLLILFASCSDDLGVKVTPDEDMKNNVTLLVPSVKGVAATRAELDDNDAQQVQEGSVRSLTLLAYPAEGGRPECIRLSEPSALTHEYATYRLTLNPGDYRIYLVANLQPYSGMQPDGDTEEDDLREMILNFSADKLPNLTDGLPMAATPSDILEELNGVITIPEYKAATITADLHFLCSKVRMTVFFDASSAEAFSHPGFGSDRPLFTEASLGNVADATIFDDTLAPSHGYCGAPASLTRMVFPADVASEEDVKNYNTSSLDGMEQSAETDVADRMAWQTTLYLPENLTTDPGKCTNLTLNAEIAASGRKISYNIPLPELVSDGSATNAAPLRRARYHDITACLKSIAGKFEMNLKVSEWTVRNLVHDLHGPYHLQVEKTEQVPVVAGEETHLWYHSDVPVSFESQRQIINGREINVLNIEKMPGFENDSIIITANPALPLDYDLNESYFHIIAGNLKKKIQIWPFTIKPFLKVSPEYTEVEVREMIESGSNTLNIPLQFTTNLSQVRVNLTEGWDEPDAPVEFKTLSTCNSPSESEYIYTGDNAHEGIVRVDMNGFIKGNAFWSDNHSLKLQFTAFDKEGNRFGSPITAEINIIPKRFKYRIYFRPAGDDWANPHVYIYQSLALPYTLDKSKVDGPYKDRAGRPVGGFVFKNIGQNSEAGLQYSFTGRLTFRGWSTQGGPADNNPYEAALFNPQTTEGFYVFGSITPSSGPNAGKTGYGLKYIPPANRSQWLVNGADEATLRKHYDIDTDYMATHRGGLTYLCPLCQGEDTYNMKYPGIRMMMSEKYPGWWYVDLSEVATPGKALVMFHDGHAVEGPLQVPGPGQPGIPLFDYPDNEGWVYYTGNQKGAFTDERPSVAAKYQEDTYRIYFPKGNKGIRLELLNAAANGVQSDLLTATSPAALKGYDADFNYVEFKLSSKLAQRRLNAYLVYSNDAEGSGMLSLPDFKSEAGIRTYTFTADANSHPGKPESGDTDITKYRIYWQQSPDVKGFNMWFNTWVMNNYDNASKSYLNIPYISGSEVLSGITYDYYEFQLPANAAAGSSGWQMHLSSGIYSYQKDVTVADFAATAANPSLKCLYRDACYNALPYAPNVSGNNYRIYWPRYYNVNDISTAWFWSASNADGFWITPTGTENVNGNQYYYYDFTDAGNLHTSHGGVIPRTTPSWSSGMAPTGKNCNFERYSFHYDTAAGRNVAFVNNSFNGIGINGL